MNRNPQAQIILGLQTFHLVSNSSWNLNDANQRKITEDEEIPSNYQKKKLLCPNSPSVSRRVYPVREEIF
jgi:hypothetical protein